MQVKIEEIRDGGLKLDEPVAREQVQEALAELGGAGFRADRGFRLQAHLQKVGTGVLLEGRFTAEVVVPCKRCNADVVLRLPQEFTLNLVPTTLARDAGLDDGGEDDGRAERAGSFRLEDAEQERFDGKVIHLDPIVREQLLLALPMSALCKEDCRGLCGVCGQDLDERACGCEVRPVDPRLAALRDIKIN